MPENMGLNRRPSSLFPPKRDVDSIVSCGAKSKVARSNQNQKTHHQSLHHLFGDARKRRNNPPLYTQPEEPASSPLSLSIPRQPIRTVCPVLAIGEDRTMVINVNPLNIFKSAHLLIRDFHLLVGLPEEVRVARSGHVLMTWWRQRGALS